MGTYWPRYSYKIKISDKKLVNLYVKKKLNFKEISEITGIATSTIRRRCIKNGVTPRKGDTMSDITLKRYKERPHRIGWKMSEEQKTKLSKIFKKIRGKTAKGWSLKPSGYIEITRGRNKNKVIHRVIMEKHLKRKLLKNEVVHHIDGNKKNNDIQNLQVMDRKEHNRLHAIENNSKRKRCKKGRYV